MDTATLEDETRDIIERSDEAWDRLDDLLRAMVRLEASYSDIEDDAFRLAYDGYGHDPRHADDYCPGCEAVVDAYDDARHMAERLAAARMSLIAHI